MDKENVAHIYEQKFYLAIKNETTTENNGTGQRSYKKYDRLR